MRSRGREKGWDDACPARPLPALPKVRKLLHTPCFFSSLPALIAGALTCLPRLPLPALPALRSAHTVQGRACQRLKYNRRFVNVVVGFGKKKGPNSQ